MRLVLGLAGALVLILIVVAGGYGYHRDELYFLTAGENLAWGFADQGPLTPAIAAAMDGIAPDSLTVLRIPAALATGGTVVLTALIARELGASPRAQILSAVFIAVAAVVLTTGHLLSTTTFDLLAWTAVTWLVALIIRTGESRLWLAAGVVTGIALLNKPLIAFLAAGLLAGFLAAGPHEQLRSGWLWAGVAIAIALGAPWFIWQADHGWPQLDVASSIAEGGSGSSEPRWAFLPFQFLLVSPMLAPVWIAGLVALVRRPSLRPYQLFAWTWVFLAIVFLITGGKPYYLAGLFPVLLAAGSIPLDEWLERGRTTVRRWALAAVIVGSGLIGGVIALPLLPQASSDIVIEVNEDIGETIGWPEFAEQVARVAEEVPGPDSPVILTVNYGEAGAIDRYGPGLGLPKAHSGHNAYWDWGPPTSNGAVVAVGLGSAEVNAAFSNCEIRDRIETPDGIENDEDGVPIWVCSSPRHPWPGLWPSLAHLD